MAGGDARVIGGALGLVVVAGGGLAWFWWGGGGWPALALALALLVGAVVLVGLALRGRRPASVGRRPDLDRLRPGRLRDYSRRATGYYLQINALAETFPQLAARAALAREVAAVEAVRWTIHEVCLAVQAYELGERQPPAGDATALVAEIEVGMQATLDRLSQLYAALREAWAAQTVEDEPLAAQLIDLDRQRARLRDLLAAFAPADARPPLTRS